MKIIDISKIVVPSEALDAVPGAVARRLKLLPLKLEDDSLMVAAADPEDIAALDQLESIVGREVKALPVVDAAVLEKALLRYYPDSVLSGTADNAAALFEQLINRALQQKASDIHVDPLREGGVVRMRIDGRMREDRRLTADTLNELVSRIKVLASLDIAEKRMPLDGQISLPLMDDVIDLRIATVPTIYGEHVTLRLLTQDDGGSLESVDKLGMNRIHHEMFSRAISCPNGIILLSGPTGSGKTTTLYAALRHLRKGADRHLVSIEDPVEKPVDGVTQIKVDSEGERVTFNKALRSVLRHDPDIVMIGEIRDGETGDIAVKAALTGHLVLSTLHTNSAAGVTSRLGNLGIPTFMIASTLRLAIAQRLVRRPCSHCMSWVDADSLTRSAFGWDPEAEIKVPEVTGCSFCGNTGYSGRTALYEMIEIDGDIRKLVLQGADEPEISRAAFGRKKLPSLRLDGAKKIIEGLTTVEEVEAVTIEDFH